MKLTPRQWIGVIAVLIVGNLFVFGSLIWLVAADLEFVLFGPVEVELPASPTMVVQASPALRPTFTPTPGAAQPSPTETPVPPPISTPVPADTAAVMDTLAFTPLPAGTPMPTDTVAPTDTRTPFPTDTPPPTSTPTLAPPHTPTDTLTPVPSDTPAPTSTPTPTSSHTPTASSTATLTPTPVPSRVEGPAPTDTVTPTPRSTVAPVAEVKVLSASSDRIDLSWKPATGSEPLTYHIYWDMGLGLGLYTYKTSVEGTRYTDLNLRPGTAYRYLIMASDGSYESSAHEVLAITRARPERVVMATSGPTQTPRPSPSQRPTATPTSTASPWPAPTSTASPSPTSTPNRTPTPSLTRRSTATPASIQGPSPSPTPRRVVATPTPLPPDTVLLGLMSSHEYEDDLGFFTIVGEVRNDLQMNVGKVLVTATFYNDSGDVIEEVSTSTMVDILLPGQRSPFALILPRPEDLWEYSLRITARPTLEQPLAGLEVVQSDTYEDEVGFYHVTGEVENTGQRTADRVQVIVTLYDRWGKIVNAGFVYSEPRRIRPGEKAAFDCSFNYYPLVKEHAIQAERD